ncbi:Sec1-like protein [Jimgerdemannia flammicorona]|uniref:Sec1-like protein n=1 Tax=Jimgerdemannia flammicorona TaxID=994334 RepID=A0A433BLZ3_9FUNG|nr:Sec1-like protein [Jimgerdemannia flammicorona]
MDQEVETCNDDLAEATLYSVNVPCFRKWKWNVTRLALPKPPVPCLLSRQLRTRPHRSFWPFGHSPSLTLESTQNTKQKRFGKPITPHFTIQYPPAIQWSQSSTSSRNVSTGSRLAHLPPQCPPFQVLILTPSLLCAFTSRHQPTHTGLLDMIRSIQPPGRWKIVVVDSKSVKTLSAACKMYDILEENVTLVENIEKTRQPYPNLEAIYFLTPCQESINRLVDDFARRQGPMYGAAHVHFTSGRLE